MKYIKILTIFFVGGVCVLGGLYAISPSLRPHYFFHEELGKYLKAKRLKKYRKLIREGKATEIEKLDYAAVLWRKYGGDRERDEAISLYESLAAKGSSSAMLQLAYAYGNENLKYYNLEKYFFYLKKSAENNNDSALYVLALEYQQGRIKDSEASDQKIEELLIKSALQHYGPALIHLAKMYLENPNVPENCLKALAYLNMANDLGTPGKPAYPEAAYLMGKMYEEGIGVPKDSYRANALFHRAYETTKDEKEAE